MTEELNVFEQDLKIMDHKKYLERHQGKYKVVYLTFKDITRESHYEAAYKTFCTEISKVYRNHQYLLESPKLGSYQKTSGFCAETAAGGRGEVPESDFSGQQGH